MAALSAPQAAIQNSLLAYVRSQEDAADRAGVRFLDGHRAVGQGHVRDLQAARRPEFSMRRGHIDPYMQSHPMPAERVRALEGLAKASPYWDKKDSPALQARHDLARAKLYGFIDPRDGVARRYPISDNSLAARYARAIAAYRFGNVPGSIQQIDALIQAQPQNPYFHELKGQALLEAGRAADAIAPLRRAVQLAPNPALIQIMLGQALLATNNKAYADEAVTLLETASRREPESPEAFDQIADGLRPQGRSRPRRSRLRSGRLRARRPEDRARACGPRQIAFPRRLAGLGQGRRHRAPTRPKPGQR